MAQLLDVSAENIQDYWKLFVNRRAYILQSLHPDEDGNYRYYRPKKRPNGEEASLNDDVVRRHLRGDLTVSLYTPNPETQRSKWFVIDGDYKLALEHLCALQYDLQYLYQIDAALEQSRRGAHLWIFCEEPLLAREGRQLLLRLAAKLQMPVKGAGQVEGLEIFPKQDELPTGEFGNAIRGPLGIHRKVQTRYWFYGAERNLADQLAYLKHVRKMTQAALVSVVDHLEPLLEPEKPKIVPIGRRARYTGERQPFHILDHIATPRKRAGRNWTTQCPSCALAGNDQSQNNLSIKIDEPTKYKCWAGCTKEMIREALGCPIPEPRMYATR
jgi:hypothetical protein